MTTLAEKIAVMQAAERGEAIQIRGNGRPEWEDVNPPSWNWVLYDYRVKPREPRRCWGVFNAGGFFYGTWRDQWQAKGFADAHGFELIEFVEVIKP